MAYTLTRVEEVMEDLLNGSWAGQFCFPEQALIDMLIQELGATQREDMERITKGAEALLRTRDDIFLSEGKVYPKNVFFQGAEFRLTPSRFELEKAILFPGSGFIPFASEEIFPDEFELACGNGKTVKTIEIKAAYADLAPSCTMLGHSGIIDYLSAESEENRRTLRNVAHLEQAVVRLAAFDLGDFYRDNEFVQGDSLIVRVEDWAQGKFSLRRCSAAEKPEPAAVEAYVADLEQALLKVCTLEKDYVEIPRQIAEAYLFAFEAGRDLRNRPVLTLEDYRLHMVEIAIRRDGPEWLLVPADDLEEKAVNAAASSARKHDHAHDGHDCCCGHGHSHAEATEALPDGRTIDPDIDPDNFTISTGAIDSLDAILTELNAPVNSVEIMAMIQDAIANGTERFDDFYAVVEGLIQPKFADDAQEVTFLNFLEDAFEVSQEAFSPIADETRAPLRSRLLEITSQRIDLSQSLLARYREKGVPQKITAAITKIHRNILDTLALITGDSLIGDDQFEQLELRVGDIEDEWDDLMSRF